FDGKAVPPRPDQMTAEWQARWNVICDRLVQLALEHGGTAQRDGDGVRLHAPRIGACIQVTSPGPTLAGVFAEDLHVECHWELTDDGNTWLGNDVEAVVRAIMEGRATVQTGAGTLDIDGVLSGTLAPRDVTLSAWSRG